MCRRFWRQWDRDPPPEHFRVKLHPERLRQPLHWKKPRRVFVCSMSDLFHETIDRLDPTFLPNVFATMALCRRHTFQVLTKRAYCLPVILTEDFADSVQQSVDIEADRQGLDHAPTVQWPLPNVSLGVTAENQKYANQRIRYLLKSPATRHFVSLEPLLGPVDLMGGSFRPRPHPITGFTTDIPWLMGSWGLNWVIIGCESGPNRRPMELEWAIDLVRQCRDADVPCFVKQIPVNGKVSKDPNEWPEELRVREYPR